jgi:single-strand DNA-binding protein
MSTSITIVGNLAKDPEIIAKDNGFRLAKLTVMTSKSKKNADGTWSNEGTTAWSCTAFEKLADNIQSSLKKGDPVIVIGEVAYNSWTDKEGKPAGRMEVTVKEIALSLKRFPVSGRRVEIATPSSQPDPWETPKDDLGAGVPF